MLQTYLFRNHFDAVLHRQKLEIQQDKLKIFFLNNCAILIMGDIPTKTVMFK